MTDDLFGEFLGYDFAVGIDVVKFHVKPIKIETNIESAKKIIKDAVKMLSLPMLQSNPDCEYCGLVASRKKRVFDEI